MLSTDCKKKRNKSRLKTAIKAGTSLLLTAMFSFIALSGSSPSLKKAEAETESDSSKKIYLSVYFDDYDDTNTGNGSWFCTDDNKNEIDGQLYSADCTVHCGTGYILLYETVHGKFTAVILN